MNSAFITSIRRVAAGMALLCITTFADAQVQALEYRYEAGVMAGGSCYYGDANYSSFMKNINVMGGLIGRYNINPRMAVKADIDKLFVTL